MTYGDDHEALLLAAALLGWPRWTASVLSTATVDATAGYDAFASTATALTGPGGTAAHHLGCQTVPGGPASDVGKPQLGGSSAGGT